jgi:hypothetical protein
MKNHIVKFILLIAITFASCTSFAASHSKIVGSWGFITNDYVEFIGFYSDGSFEMIGTADDFVGIASGHYIIKGNKVTIKFTSKIGDYEKVFHHDTYVSTYKVNNNKLYLTNPASGMGVKYIKLKY